MSTKFSGKTIRLLVVFSLTVTFCVPAVNAIGNQKSNGITVGRPKVFDNRTLTIMMESLSESLRNMQFVDQKTLASALGLLQGFRSTEVVSNFSAGTLPIPALKQETITNTGNVSTAGTPLPDTTKQTTTNDRAAFTPAVPTLDTLPAFSGFNPNYGQHSSDLLSDQVNLTYQIFNLRMLLERSLSDRVLSQGQPRRQAVLGFNVSIDPPRTADDAVAVVEITLKLASGSGRTDGLDLVSVMPQEKTYNAAALSTKSNAFGGAAAVKMIQVGYSERRRGQTFYLYRDTDTVAYERMVGDKTGSAPSEVVFGWMFRPVLGRRSISPGLRQLFAIVSLPTDDSKSNLETQILSAHVKTSWKKYDQDTMTSFESDEANRASRFKYALSLNLSKPEIFASRYENKADYFNIEVKPTNKYQTDLQPNVLDIWWVPVGTKSVLVSATGNNFFSGTQVTMGDKMYASSADGLILKSNQSFDLTTSLEALAAGSGAIIGRYGQAAPLIGNPEPGVVEPDGVQILATILGPSLSGKHTLDIALRSRSGKDLQLKDLPSHPTVGQLTPIVTVNDKVVPLPYTLTEKSENNGLEALTIQTTIPDAFISNGGGTVKVSWPFRSDRWTSTWLFSDPAANLRIIRLDAKRMVLLTSQKLGFRGLKEGDCWELLVGEKTFKLPSTTCTTATNPAVKRLSNNAIDVTLQDPIPDKVVLLSFNKFPNALDVPKATAVAPAAPKPIELKQYDAVWIDIAVEDNEKVGSAEANGLTLQLRRPTPDKDHKTVQVQIPQALTAKPGHDVDITLLDKKGDFLGKARLHISCQNCNNDGGKQ